MSDDTWTVGDLQGYLTDIGVGVGARLLAITADGVLLPVVGISPSMGIGAELRLELGPPG